MGDLGDRRGGHATAIGGTNRGVSGSLNPPNAPSLAPASARPSTCILLVDDRVLLRANGPPEAEYALFDVEEVELRSSEPGRVREHGFQTTAGLARERLAALGATEALGREVAASFQPILAEAYARGTAIRRIAKILGPAELLATDAYDATTRGYRGVYLDLAALADGLARPSAGAELQALHLAIVLATTRDDAKIVLSTDAWTKGRRPGDRTHRRPALAGIGALHDALIAQAEAGPAPYLVETLPREDVLALLRTKADSAETEEERAMVRSLLGSVVERVKPERGPLSDPALWDIEQRMEAGKLAGVVEALEHLERLHGRTPGTTYLRGRASLLLRLEPARLVAERVSALALSMTSFQELSLLAAEAWLDAGEPRRAMPYARDLVDAPMVDDGLLIRAQQVMARVVGAAPGHAPAKTMPVALQAAMPPNQAPTTTRPPAPVTAPDPQGASSFEQVASPTPTARGTPPGGTEPPGAPRTGTSPGMGAVTASRSGSSLAAAATTAPSRIPPASMPSTRAPEAPRPTPRVTPMPPMRPAALELDLPPPPVASFTLDLPADPGDASPPVSGALSEGASPPASQQPRRRTSMVRFESVAPKSSDPRAEPDDPPFLVPAMPAVPRLDADLLAAAVTVGPEDPDCAGRRALEAARPPSVAAEAKVLDGDLLSGASLPPFKIEPPPPGVRSASPTRAPPPDDLAEHLSLPEDAGPELVILDGRPATPLEARIQMTRLARQLGLDYRLKRGILLRADIAGIEAMQAHLLDSFPDRTVRRPEDVLEVRRHGALFSEILVRHLGAEWIDVASDEIGYWAMHVPPDVRIWPFARVARLIAVGHRERDLVSTFLELRGRSPTSRG